MENTRVKTYRQQGCSGRKLHNIVLSPFLVSSTVSAEEWVLSKHHWIMHGCTLSHLFLPTIFFPSALFEVQKPHRPHVLGMSEWLSLCLELFLLWCRCAAGFHSHSLHWYGCHWGWPEVCASKAERVKSACAQGDKDQGLFFQSPVL